MKEEFLDKYRQLVNPDEISVGGVTNYASLLTSSSQVSTLSDRVLNLVGEGTNGDLRKQVFPFKDIMEVNTDDLKSVLQNVDRGDIAFALMEQDEDLIEKVLGAMEPNIAIPPVTKIHNRTPARKKTATPLTTNRRAVPRSGCRRIKTVGIANSINGKIK